MIIDEDMIARIFKSRKANRGKVTVGCTTMSRIDDGVICVYTHRDYNFIGLVRENEPELPGLVCLKHRCPIHFYDTDPQHKFLYCPECRFGKN